jgi:hypothetical protein
MTAWELNDVTVSGLDDSHGHLHSIEGRLGHHLGNPLSIQFGDYGFSNLHEASNPGGLVDHLSASHSIGS